MTTDQLKDLLAFEPALQSVEILTQAPCEHGATFIRANIHYSDFDMTVPFVWYEGNDWLFTPCDWQGKLPQTPAEIADIDWRVDDTDTEGVIFDGLPMLAPWAPDPQAIKERARLSVGEQVRAARQAKGLSTRQLAEKCALSHSHIVRIESGRYAVTVDTLGQIAAALNVSITIG